MITCNLIIVLVIPFVSTQWVTETILTLPRGGDDLSAIGYYNDTISLLGGRTDGYQLIQYNIEQNLYTHDNVSELSDDTYGRGIYYTQIEHILYMIDPDGDKFSVFNLKTNKFQNNWNNITINTNGGEFACLASTNELLFVTGGYNQVVYLRSLQIFNITSMRWLSDGPTMITQRSYHSCIVHPLTERLYVIGGYSNNQYHSSIEYIPINDILNRNWTWNPHSLYEYITETSVIVYEHQIWVIGGYPDTSGVEIIDTSNDGFISWGPSLNYIMCCGSAIVVNKIIYVFGGSNTGMIDTWQYYMLPTNAPTQPTNVPTTTFPTTNAPNTPSPTTDSPTTSSPTTGTPTTDSPTASPTTDSPTSTSPTTVTPTINPTLSPVSNIPTTNHPITLSPITYSPTLNQTETLLDSTVSETLSISTYSSIIIIPTPIDSNTANTKILDLDHTIFTVIIVLFSIICCLLGLGLVFYWKYKKAQKLLYTLKSTEMTSIDTEKVNDNRSTVITHNNVSKDNNSDSDGMYTKPSNGVVPTKNVTPIKDHSNSESEGMYNTPVQTLGGDTVGNGAVVEKQEEENNKIINEDSYSMSQSTKQTQGNNTILTPTGGNI